MLCARLCARYARGWKKETRMGIPVGIAPSLSSNFHCWGPRNPAGIGVPCRLCEKNEGATNLSWKYSEKLPGRRSVTTFRPKCSALKSKSRGSIDARLVPAQSRHGPGTVPARSRLGLGSDWETPNPYFVTVSKCRTNYKITNLCLEMCRTT